MSGGRVLDLDALLSPISDSAPTGVDLREDSAPQPIYLRLKDARSAARAAERSADRGGDPDEVRRTAGEASSQWRTVLDLSQQALAKQSKDLEIASWLVEAALRAHGFAGLRDGFVLLNGLVTTYWDSLHSIRDEEGMTSFVAPLAALNGVEADGTLIQPIRRVPVTAGDGDTYAAYQFDQAEALAKITDKAAHDSRVAAGVPTVEQFESALRASPKEFLRALVDDLAGSLEALAALSTALTEKIAADAPSTSTIRNALEKVRDLVVPRTQGLLPAATPATNGAAEPAAADYANGAAAPKGGAMDRDAALRMLAEVADFFRATEPHSPIAFTLDEVIRRAHMSLPELLAELLPDAAARRTFLTTAGIRAPDVK
ncbi:MAG TPA: type VI secretion system protein TssA [Stellaceae bacterium]|jgi:type VI secretion system protein ImpA|nr:type VI secretion system protein TssA [Stellaceae bacterium]